MTGQRDQPVRLVSRRQYADLRRFVRGVIGTRMVHATLNRYDSPLDFELPPVADGSKPWRRILDTALDSPDDAPIDQPFYQAEAHSMVLLEAVLR